MYTNEEWRHTSSKHLDQEIDRLQQHIFDTKPNDIHPFPPGELPATPDDALTAFERFSHCFELSPIERLIVLFLASWELDESFRKTCAKILKQNSPNPFPNPSLIRELLPQIHQRHFGPNSILNRYQLITPAPEQYFLIDTPLKLNRWVLHYLMGEHTQDPTFPATLHPKPLDPTKHPLPDSYTQLIEQIALQWDSANTAPLTQLCGSDPKAHHLIAAETSDQYGYQLVHIKASAFNQERPLLNQWLTHWKRLSTLYNHILLLEVTAQDLSNPSVTYTLTQLIETQKQPLFLSLPERLANYPDALSLDVPDLSIPEQKQQWFYHLGNHAPELKEDIGKIVAQFNTTLHNIRTITHRAITQIENPREGITPKPLPQLVWQICRTESRSRLEGLVERIQPKTTWDDLILPPASHKELLNVIETCRNRSIVFDEWGMGGNTHRGNGVSSLFHGPSGTGKTTAAEIIAHELDLDLYRVDLSQVSSKYIGETEKNLKKIFDAAQESGAVLLFDEADSIIGKRSEVKDSKDQYANQTVGYLLQAIERYSGLSILTTNLPNALDTAFNRRLNSKIRFEYPTQEQRVKIWQKNFPPKVPTKDLCYIRLSQVVLSGATIRKAAIRAGNLAITDQEPVQMKHAYRAILGECLSDGRPLTDDEIRGWDID